MKDNNSQVLALCAQCEVSTTVDNYEAAIRFLVYHVKKLHLDTLLSKTHRWIIERKFKLWKRPSEAIIARRVIGLQYIEGYFLHQDKQLSIVFNEEIEKCQHNNK